MPKILMQGDKAIDVSIEVALRAKESWTAGDDKVDIGSQVLKGSKIVSIDMSDSAPPDKDYDLNNQSDRELIKEFEREIESVRSSVPDNIEFYGRPIKEIPAVLGLPKKVLSDGFVKNDVLGLTHAGVVKYCLDNGFIGRSEDKGIVHWGYTPRYYVYSKKRKALDDLNFRRDYARKLDEESMDQLTKAKQSLFKKI
ncbi:MAG: hypothetical protein H7831_09940 [Magnetococcus sp. WYHC-3]